MSDNKILLGKRHFLFYREQKIDVEGWAFSLPQHYCFIAGGDEESPNLLISLYRDSEKMAQLSLINKKSEIDLGIQAIASDVIIEISECNRTVTVVEKR